MIIVLSPAKTLDYDFEANNKHSVPSFLGQSSKLIKQLKQKEPKDIGSLMGLSDKLASLNYDRYQSWTASKKGMINRLNTGLLSKTRYQPTWRATRILVLIFML